MSDGWTMPLSLSSDTITAAIQRNSLFSFFSFGTVGQNSLKSSDVECSIILGSLERIFT